MTTLNVTADYLITVTRRDQLEEARNRLSKEGRTVIAEGDRTTDPRVRVITGIIVVINEWNMNIC